MEEGTTNFNTGNGNVSFMYQSNITHESILNHKKEKLSIKRMIINFLYWLLEKLGEDGSC